MALSEWGSGEPGVFPRVAWVGRASWGSTHGDVRDGVWVAGEVAWVGRLVCDESVGMVTSFCLLFHDWLCPRIKRSFSKLDVMVQVAFSLRKGLSPPN